MPALAFKAIISVSALALHVSFLYSPWFGMDLVCVRPLLGRHHCQNQSKPTHTYKIEIQSRFCMQNCYSANLADFLPTGFNVSVHNVCVHKLNLGGGLHHESFCYAKKETLKSK